MTLFKYILPVFLSLQIILGNVTGIKFGNIISCTANVLYSTDAISSDVMLDTKILNQRSGSIDAITGCGPTSAAMLLISEKRFDITKDEAVVNAYSKGFYYYAGYNFTSGLGVTQENIQSLIRDFGFDSEIDHMLYDSSEEIIQKIDSQLNKGHRLIVGHLARHGNRFLHYALIYGRHTKNGETFYNIADPWGGLDSEWSRDDLFEKINSVYASGPNSFEGMVKGIQWLV